MASEVITYLEQQCLADKLEFGVVTRWQYVVSPSQNLKISMRKEQIGRLNVFIGEGVTTVTLLDRLGLPFGFLLGIAVSDQGLLRGSVHLNFSDLSSDAFWRDFENWIIQLAGRYTIICDCVHGARVYNDASGSNGCVYNREDRIAASSSLLCLDRPPVALPHYNSEKVLEGYGKYSLFHTCDAAVRRANPSFFLDLDSFEETRFWPRNQAFEVPKEDYWGVYERLAEIGRRTIAGINAHFKTVAALSGGQDSRLLLAFAGAEVRGFDSSFSHIHNYASRIDSCISSEIARRLQIRLDVFDKRKVRRNQKQIRLDRRAFLLGSGYAMPAPREMQMNLHSCLPERAIVFRGHQTDILRAVFIDKPGQKARENFFWQIKRLLLVPRNEFGTVEYEQFFPYYQEWVSTVPPGAHIHTVDLMFLEIYYSSTIGASFPSLSHNFFMSPFNSREFIQLAMSIDEVYRRNSYAVNDILMYLNPSLHDIPFDYEFGGARDLEEITNIPEMDKAVSSRREASLARYLARGT